jgi:PAS domain S-box-containing protein
MSAVIELKLMPESPNAEFVSLFQNSPLALAQCGTEGRVIALNAAMERMVGTQRSQSKTPGLSDLIQAQDRDEADGLIAELLEGKREFFQIRTSCGAGAEAIARKNGRPLNWTVWRVSMSQKSVSIRQKQKEDAPGRILAIAVPDDAPPADVFAKENSVRERDPKPAGSLETMGRLTGGVAHDFNNLLTGVLLYCDLMMATLEPDHRARRYAEEIRNAGLQAGGLIRQLLAVSRPAQGGSRPLSLNETVEGLHPLLNRLIGENIELRLNLSSSVGLIEMDPTQAQQILLNLVLNARDAMPSGGEITVETSDGHVQIFRAPDQAPSDQASGEQGPSLAPSLRCAMLVVADHGCGMDAATRAHLFEPFFTTKAATNLAGKCDVKEGQGTGLGLATVHDIVTGHGGLIDVDSEPGRGTRVTVLLPVFSPAAVATTSTIFPTQSGFHFIHGSPAQSGERISFQKEERPL